MTRRTVGVLAACAALACVAVAIRFGLSVESLQYFALVGLLVYASYTDLQSRTIANGCIVACAAVRLIYGIYACACGLAGFSDITYYLVSGIALGGAVLLFALVFERLTGRAGMGGGDIKLYAVAGLYVGFEGGLFVVLASCLVAAIVGLAFSSRDSQERMRRAMPFGPAIALALVMVILVR